ncbi:hypothetical protein [Hyalangium sp.]|uniref:hypothetical protein n=1 Tax=Hyalangium sp. TaxID=2028555 RepID=UPI002D4F2D3D|nr:hypothetical protein [Hyalangium sp.]HYI00560.1 hypothetical protein [Hyalangium sp.]
MGKPTRERTPRPNVDTVLPPVAVAAALDVAQRLTTAEGVAQMLEHELDALLSARKDMADWQREALGMLVTQARCTRLQLRGHRSFVLQEVGRG